MSCKYPKMLLGLFCLLSCEEVGKSFHLDVLIKNIYSKYFNTHVYYYVLKYIRKYVLKSIKYVYILTHMNKGFASSGTFG